MRFILFFLLLLSIIFLSCDFTAHTYRLEITGADPADITLYWYSLRPEILVGQPLPFVREDVRTTMRMTVICISTSPVTVNFYVDGVMANTATGLTVTYDY